MTSLLDGLVSMVAQEALKYTVLSGRTAVQEALSPDLLVLSDVS